MRFFKRTDSWFVLSAVVTLLVSAQASANSICADCGITSQNSLHGLSSNVFSYSDLMGPLQGNAGLLGNPLKISPMTSEVASQIAGPSSVTRSALARGPLLPMELPLWDGSSELPGAFHAETAGFNPSFQHPDYKDVESFLSSSFFTRSVPEPSWSSTEFFPSALL